MNESNTSPRFSTSNPADRAAIALAYTSKTVEMSDFRKEVAAELEKRGLTTDNLSRLCAAACRFVINFPAQESRHV